MAWLLEELHAADTGAGAGAAVRTLLDRDPAGQARLDRPQDVAGLLRALRLVGAGDAVTSLATRAAASISLESPRETAWLLEELQAAGAGDAIQVLLARDPAARVSLGFGQQQGVTRLRRALYAAGAAPAAAELARRAANAGMFDLAEDRDGYPFGREPDGTPAPPWRWMLPPVTQ